MFSFSQGDAKDASDKSYQWQTFVICNPYLSLKVAEHSFAGGQR